MSQIEVKLPDGSVKEFDSEINGFQLAKSISPGLAKAAVAMKINGTVTNLSDKIPTGSPVEILTFDNAQGREVFWHSSSHIMAQAVMELFPETKLAIGPPIDEGWYYDFEVKVPFTPEDLEKIEKKMVEIVKENVPFTHETKNRLETIEYFKKNNAIYKVEILEGIEDDNVTFYYQSRFQDLCRGPHIPKTGIVKALKLTATSGAYWRGDENNTMLQRIYGVSYPKKEMMEEYLYRMEEAKKETTGSLAREWNFLRCRMKSAPV